MKRANWGDPKLRYATMGGCIGLAISLSRGIADGQDIGLLTIVTLVSGTVGVGIGWVAGWVVSLLRPGGGGRRE